MAFEKFLNRVVINAKLVAVTPIYVGAQANSFRPGAVNGACVKDAYGRPYIPGSSLKGVLRAFLSGVLDEPVESRVNVKFKTKSQRDEYGSPEELADAIIAVSTPVESLFGSTAMAGKVKIADAMPVESRVSTEVRNGVAIDRDTHTALGTALFETEVVPSGTAFNFIASAENLTPCDADMFGQLMECFAEGSITVGGRSRAGLGNVKLSDVRVTVYRAAKVGFPEPETTACANARIREAISKCSKN